VLPMNHLDGTQVVVIDSHGRHVPAVDEVRIEPGIAVVAVKKGARAWVQSMLREPNELLECAIHSLSGQLHHCGAVRISCV
jgi:hypothetical protein